MGLVPMDEVVEIDQFSLELTDTSSLPGIGIV